MGEIVLFCLFVSVVMIGCAALALLGVGAVCGVVWLSRKKALRRLVSGVRGKAVGDDGERASA